MKESKEQEVQVDQQITEQAKSAMENFKMPNRRSRRMALKFQGLIKMKNQASFADRAQLRRDTIKRGTELHQQNVNEVDKKLFEFAEAREASQVKAWSEIGYNAKEIEMLKEANAIINYKTVETWSTDKKTARKLMADARKSLESRTS